SGGAGGLQWRSPATGGPTRRPRHAAPLACATRGGGQRPARRPRPGVGLHAHPPRGQCPPGRHAGRGRRTARFTGTCAHTQQTRTIIGPRAPGDPTMKLFRNLLFWIVLALVGALVAQMLMQDPGHVLVRFRGMDYTTTLAAVVLVGVAVLLALWLLWKLVTAPVLGLRRRRRRAARARLYEGLEDYELGHWERAAQRLDDAARSPVIADDGSARLAHIAAARAAMATGDRARVERHPHALEGRPAERAVLQAEAALADGRPDEALQLLDVPAAQPLPPHGLALRVRALDALGRHDEAYGLLGALRAQHALPASELDRLQARWAAGALAQASDANALADRWEAMP